MQLLPRDMVVAFRCVIDSFGTTGRQLDVIFYVENLCPVFSVNENPASTYYPCERVITAGD